jgi:glutamate synthase (NADPH) small chain
MISKIITQTTLSEQLVRLEIKKSGKFEHTGPGQYVIAHSLTEKASVTLPVLKYEPASEILTALIPGNEELADDFLWATAANNQVEMEGPFGQPFRIENFGSVLCVANYDCMIPLLPVILALRAAGNRTTCLLTQNEGSNPTLEGEIHKNTDQWIAAEENPRRSSQLFEQPMRMQKYDQVFAIGHIKTIRETINISTSTRTPIQTMLFLNSWNRTGKHGIFRVNACCKNHIICVDGHNFNAHYTNFDDIAKRFGCEELQPKSAEKTEINV